MATKGCLLSQIKRFDEVLIAIGIPAFQVIQEFSAFSDHGKQPASAMVVFLVLFQMLGELVDSLRQNGDLHLSRAGVFGVAGMLGYDFFLGFSFHEVGCL
jgi:hypothetical protein